MWLQTGACYLLHGIYSFPAQRCPADRCQSHDRTGQNRESMVGVRGHQASVASLSGNGTLDADASLSHIRRARETLSHVKSGDARDGRTVLHNLLERPRRF